jgi:hypothetical protein
MKAPFSPPAGLFSDDTTSARGGQWVDMSNMRFWNGQAQVVGGWEAMTLTALTGVCRGLHAWTNKAGLLNVAFGTHSALQVWLDGILHTITPTLALPAKTLAADPLSTQAGSPTVTVTQAGHPHQVGEKVALSGVVAVGGITPAGDVIVTTTDADHWSFTWSANAASAAVGGGSAVVATPARLFTAGEVDGTGGAGYGTGAYSTGEWSEPSLTAYFPRTWSKGNFGEILIACPRGGVIYEWTNNPALPAVPIANAPAKVTACLVTPKEQVMALGCNEEVSGAFNPVCIRYSSVRKRGEWNTGAATTAREYILPGGGYIVGGRVMGDYILVWTGHGLHIGTFSANLAQPWSFKRVQGSVGLIGPNAAVVVGNVAYWLGPDLQFYAYPLGGSVTPMPCPIRDDMEGNFAASQGDKVFASSLSSFGEIRFEYPDARDGFECSRYLAYSTLGDVWSRGIMARSAMLDAGPQPSPIGVSPGGSAYWHERGESDDGAPFSWFIESGDLELDPNRSLRARKFYPDFKAQKGPITVTISTRQEQQGRVRTYAPFSVAPGQGQADFLGSGRIFRIRYSGHSSPTAGRLGKASFDVVQTGGGR